MKYKKLLQLATDEVANEKKAQNKFFPSYAKTQGEVIELVDLYWVDQFRDGDTTPSGWKRSFYNYIRYPTQVNQKQIDFDSKDVLLLPYPGTNYHDVWWIQMDLQRWMQQRMFGMLLNQSVYHLPKYGSILLMKAGGNIHNVPIQNVTWDSTKNKITDMEFITQTHTMSPVLVERMGWDEGVVSASMRDAKGEEIKLYSRFGKVKGETSNFWVFDQFGNVFFDAKFESVEELYRKHDWESIFGRALGRGTVETLFEAQIQINRVQNYKTEGLHWSSKHVFQTLDVNARSNLMHTVDNGTLLTPGSLITNVPMEERNLHAYREEEQRLDTLQQRLTFAYAEVAGERPPAGTTLGQSQIQSMSSSTFFDQRREELGMFWSNVIEDWVLPDFRKESAKAHSVMLSELTPENMEHVRMLIENNLYNESVFDYMGRTGRIPSGEDAAFLMEVAKVEARNKKQLDFRENLYKDVKYKVRVVMTNEALDVGAKMATYQNLIAMVAGNPNLLQNATIRTLLNRSLALVGETPISVGLETSEETGAQSGSLPRANPVPTMTNAATVV